MHAVRIVFHHAIHVDSRGTGTPEAAEEFVRSDTLSAALCVSWGMLWPGTGADFYQAPPFRVSSAFPFVGDVLLFPAPVWPIWREVDEFLRKRLKAVRWLSRGVMDRVRSGALLSLDDIRIVHRTIALLEEEYAASPEKWRSPPWAISERQRVRIDRSGLGEEGDTFFFGLQFFAPDAGLWFLLDAGPGEEEKALAALALLGDNGLGSDRSSGLGHFTVRDVQPFDIGGRKTPNMGIVTLSLCNPTPEECHREVMDGAAYGLETRSGWVHGAAVGRPPIRAFSEGSFFPRRLAGRVIEMIPPDLKKKYDLAIGHTAPRDFRAVYLPCAAPRSLKEAEQ